jgi:putative transposase
MPIFRHGFDKRKYLMRFAMIAAEENVSVHAYCLMDNHVHWILTPRSQSGLARLFSRVHTWWAMRFNRLKGRVGHLFQNRYHSSPMDESHYWTALRYVELNPRRAGLVRHAEEWAFSSAKSRVSGEKDPFIELVNVETRRQFTASQWRAFLDEQDHCEATRTIQRAIAGSRPCGSTEWVKSLERAYRPNLLWSPPGRPRNVSSSPELWAC